LYLLPTMGTITHTRTPLPWTLPAFYRRFTYPHSPKTILPVPPFVGAHKRARDMPGYAILPFPLRGVVPAGLIPAFCALLRAIFL